MTKPIRWRAAGRLWTICRSLIDVPAEPGALAIFVDSPTGHEVLEVHEHCHDVREHARHRLHESAMSFCVSCATVNGALAWGVSS